jgi:putative inorganic carbon (HCO3(-)) transporter
MRALLLTAAIFGMLPLVFVQPQVGVLLFYWISLMNPHRLVWGGSYSFQYALIVALATMVAWIFGRERKAVPLTAPTVLVGLLWLWMSLTTLTALSPAAAYVKWELMSKIVLMTFVTIPIMQSRVRLHALIWITAASLGYYGVKGGGFAILTGGLYRVSGPADSFIGDNNAIALALDMVLPLIWYLRLNSRSALIRHGLAAAIILTVLAVVATYSRGGLLGLSVILGAVLIRSRHRIALALGIVVVSVGTLSFLPDQWYDRMRSIGSYDEDASAQGRLAMWKMAVEIARDRPIVGGGFKVFTDPAVYPRYNPAADVVRDVHSIYFETLGEHGIIGFALFLGLGAATLWQLASIRRRAKPHKELRWAFDMASMLFVSLVGYAVAGAFLTLATFDLYYLLIGVTVALRQTVRASLKELSASPPTTLPAAAAWPGSSPAPSSRSRLSANVGS